MNRPVGLTDLPVELLLNILQRDQITWLDLLSVYQTCSRLQQVAATGFLWMSKLRNKWPDQQRGIRSDMNWNSECKNMISTFELCQKKLMELSHKFYWSNVSPNIPNMQDFVDMSKMHNGFGEMYLLMLLRDLCSRLIIINDPNPHTGLYNLTNQYYGFIVLNFLNQNFIKKTFTEMKDDSSMTLEKASLLYSQWMQPEYEELNSQFEAKISYFINLIKSTLASDHPLHNIKPEESKEWSKQLRFQSKYDPESCKEVIKSAITVLKDEGVFSHKDPSQSSATIQNNINKNKRNVCNYLVILEAILRRCGLFIVLTDYHELELQWCDNYSTISTIYTIDPLDAEIVVNPNSHSVEDMLKVNSYVASEYLSYVLKCIEPLNINSPNSEIKRTLELKKFFYFQETEEFSFPGSKYAGLKYKKRLFLRKIERPLTHFQKMLDWYESNKYAYIYYSLRKSEQDENTFLEKTVKLRSDSIKFAVGQVCFLKGTKLLGVICGWEIVNTDTSEKPLYNILLSDSTERSVCQEDLELPSKPKRLKFIDNRVGKHFSHFDGYMFVPNLDKEEEYPDDGAVRAEYRNLRKSKKTRKNNM